MRYTRRKSESKSSDFRTILIGHFCCLVLISTGLIPGVQAKENDKEVDHQLTVEQFLRVKRIDNLRVSPNGKEVAFTVQTYDLQANTIRKSIWTVPLEGGEPKQLTEDGGVDSDLAWSPDGKRLAFISTRGGGSTVGVMDADGKNQKRLGSIERRNSNLGLTGTRLAWSPDGRFLAFTSAVGKDIASDEPMVFDRALFNADYGLADKKRLHVWVIPVAGGSPKQLTDGDFDHHSIGWSPDSRSIALVSNQTGRDDDNANNDIFQISVPDGVLTRVTSTAGPEYSPNFSSDSRWIGYLARQRSTANKDSNPEDTHLYVIPASGGQAQDLTSSLDRRVQEFVWSADENTVYFTAQNHGAIEIYRTSLQPGSVRKVLSGSMAVTELQTAPKGRLVYVSTTEADPGDVWVANSKSGERYKLTHFNELRQAEGQFSEAQSFWFDSFDGTRIQGFLLLPRGFDPSRRYPMVLVIKGGPHSQQGYSFRLYEQLYAADGYIVLMINYRGSSGYGQEFADANYRDLLGSDYQDLMAGVDYAVKAYPFIDASRLGVTGVSYGGYMTNWVVTQTNRFGAAVSISSISNNVSLYGNSSIQLWLESELGARFWEDWDIYWKTSPIVQVRNVKTPTLFIHGEEDHICPVSQAEEMFTSMQKLGVPSALAVYPNEGHGFPRRPDRRLDALQRALDWMDFHLKGLVVPTIE